MWRNRMRMGYHGPRDMCPGVDIEIAGRTIETFRADFKDSHSSIIGRGFGFEEHAHNAPRPRSLLRPVPLPDDAAGCGLCAQAFTGSGRGPATAATTSMNSLILIGFET